MEEQAYTHRRSNQSHMHSLQSNIQLQKILDTYLMEMAIGKNGDYQQLWLSATLAIGKTGIISNFGYQQLWLYEKKGTCSACDKIFVSRSARDRHRRTMHDTSSYTCPELRQEFFNGDGRTLMPLLMTLLNSVSVSNTPRVVAVK